MKIFLLATVQAGADIARLIARRGIRLEAIIGLHERAASDATSGYTYMAPVAAEVGTEFIAVETYTLSADADRRVLLSREIDVLIVYGWQRLVPEWLIAHCMVGVIGSHGSADGISGGRGRSPQNWALILDAQKFTSSIFFIDPGVDSGAVIASREFRYEETDDIASSYVKSVLVTADMLVDALSSRERLFLAKQEGVQGEGARYLPQRRPEDGAIDWTRSPRDVQRFIAALTRPYPGAFTLLGGGKLIIWRARPITLDAGDGADPPGSIVLHTQQGAFVVRVASGFMLVEDYELVGEGLSLPSAGEQLISVSFAAQMLGIARRHQDRYPDQPLNDAIVAAGAVRSPIDQRYEHEISASLDGVEEGATRR